MYHSSLSNSCCIFQRLVWRTSSGSVHRGRILLVGRDTMDPPPPLSRYARSGVKANYRSTENTPAHTHTCYPTPPKHNASFTPLSEETSQGSIHGCKVGFLGFLAPVSNKPFPFAARRCSSLQHPTQDGPLQFHKNVSVSSPRNMVPKLQASDAGLMLFDVVHIPPPVSCHNPGPWPISSTPSEEGVPPPPPWIPLHTKVTRTTVGTNEIYHWENLVGPFLVHTIPPPPPPHGLGVCIWMHLVNSTGNSPSPGQPTLELSNRTSHPGAPLTQPKHVRTHRGSE